MSKTRLLDSNQRDDLLAEASRRQLHATLTVRANQGWQTFKGRFTTDPRDASGFRLLLTNVHDLDESLTCLHRSNIGCTFRFGHKKCMLASTVVTVEPTTGGLAVKIAWPEKIQQLQRRLFERAEVPGGSVIPVRFWRENSTPGNPGGRKTARHGQLENLSVGGMRVRASDLTDVCCGVTYQCVFAPRTGSPAIVTSAILRHREGYEEGRVCLGFQFVGLETSDEGTRAIERLAQVVQHLHRVGARKPRKAAS